MALIDEILSDILPRFVNSYSQALPTPIKMPINKIINTIMLITSIIQLQ